MVPGYLLDVAALAQGREAFTSGVFKRIHVTLEECVFFIQIFFFFLLFFSRRIENFEVES